MEADAGAESWSYEGVHDYTVVAANNTVVVQFREPKSSMVTEMLAIVPNAHPKLVIGCSFHGTIGASPELLLLRGMDKLPGDIYSNINLCMSDDI